MMTLEQLKGLVVIDEAQTRPELFPVLRVLADRRPLPAKFLILGSVSPHLIKGCSETLAGRVEFVDMAGFTCDEVDSMEPLWLRGGFPDSFLAASDGDSFAWRQQFVRTFLQRDLPQLGITIPSTQMGRFWTMLAHSHGQIWNASELAASMGVAHTTVRRWLDILSDTFMIRQLQPWHENLGKRMVKSPKIYLRDSGLAHTLLGIETIDDLRSHPKLGASWEGFALEQVARSIHPECDAYFWSTYSGAELDLLVIRKGKKIGYEFKCCDAPTLTKSMKSAADCLKLDSLQVVYPVGKRYPLAHGVEAVPFKDIQAQAN